MKRPRMFLTLWTMAVVATTSAFVVHLALRNRELELGYALGRSQGRIARLREVKRVMELELASNGTPGRVELVAKALFKMSPPTPDRIISMGPLPRTSGDGDVNTEGQSSTATGGPE